MRILLACFAALALFATACGDDDTSVPSSGDTATSASTTSTSSSSTTAATTSTAVPTGPIELGASCESSDGFTIHYPDGWDAVADCGQFGPAPVDEPEPQTDERTGVVSAYVDTVSFGDAAAPGETETARATTTVDGLQAVRVASTGSGAGLYPAGTEEVRWMVDLAIGTDDGAGTLFVDAVDVFDDVDFDRAVRVLDEMARGIEIRAGDQPQTEQVVARFEGGGTPLTVAAAGAASQPNTCLRLVDVDAAIACVEPVEEPGGLAMTGLDSPSGTITVGIAGPDVWAVELTTADGSSLTHLPVPYPARDSLGFALPVSPDDVAAVELLADDGSVLASPDPASVRRPAS